MPKIFLLIAVVVVAQAGFAQSTELHVGVGAYFPINNPSASTSAFVVQGTFAHRVFSVPMAGLYFEVPVAKTLDVDLTFGRASYSALFVTPGFKLKLAPAFPVSPYFVAGVGVARFTQSAPGITETSDNAVAADIGGGVDMKIAPFVSLRGEFRDYYGGRPVLPLSLPGAERQHNLVTTGGLVIRF
jgi:Outer membrane protein beta-barrel domain